MDVKLILKLIIIANCIGMIVGHLTNDLSTLLLNGFGALTLAVLSTDCKE